MSLVGDDTSDGPPSPGRLVAERSPYYYLVSLIPHTDRCTQRLYKPDLTDAIRYSQSNRAFHYLSDLFSNPGKMAEAEKIYQLVLNGWEKAWGPEHISTLDIVNNLGSIYTDQGKMVEAEKINQRALSGYEEA